jgi:phosphopentomutase
MDTKARLALSLTHEEIQRIRENAKKANMKIGHYVMSAVDNKPIFEIPNNLSDLIIALNRQGNNLNQLARTANSQKFVTADILKAIKENQKILDTAVTKITEILNTVNIYRERKKLEINTNFDKIIEFLEKALLILKTERSAKNGGS